MSRIRILLADDHRLIRGGIRSLLEKNCSLQVLAEASDGLEAVRLAAALKPDVVVMDIAMKGLNGLEATRRLLEAQPKLKIIILSMHVTEQYVGRALRLGVAGYLAKRSATGELEMAVEAVMRGQTYLCAEIPPRCRTQVSLTLCDDPLQRLTARQREVLQLIAEGETNKSIADRLGLSIKTVEVHRTNLMAQLGLHDLSSLIRFAIRNGVISPDE